MTMTVLATAPPPLIATSPRDRPHPPSLAQRYLARIDAAPPTAPDLPSLTRLLEAHQRAIPFENIASYLQTGPDVAPAVAIPKLLAQRGGYCMEHEALVTPALRELGFSAQPAMARVYISNAPNAGARSHLFTRVAIGHHQYIYDGGFGANSPRIPLCLTRGDAPQGPRGAYRVVAARSLGDEARYGADALFVVQCRKWVFGAGPLETALEGDSEWMSLWGFTSGPAVAGDIAAFNWFVARRPGMLFVDNFVASRNGGEWLSVFNRTVTRRTTREKKRMESEDELRAVLAELGIEVGDDIVRGLWDKLCREGK